MVMLVSAMILFLWRHLSCLYCCGFTEYWSVEYALCCSMLCLCTIKCHQSKKFIFSVSLLWVATIYCIRVLSLIFDVLGPLVAKHGGTTILEMSGHGTTTQKTRILNCFFIHCLVNDYLHKFRWHKIFQVLSLIMQNAPASLLSSIHATWPTHFSFFVIWW